MISVAVAKCVWVIMLGAPGCGKGTQAEYLTSEKGFVSISVGDLLRDNKDTEVPSEHKTVGELISTGSLLPDSFVIDLVRSEVKKIKPETKGVLFDGFPRTVGQAEALDKLAKEFGCKIDKVLNFVVKDDIITKRILGRYKCSSCGKIYNKFFLNPKIEGVCDVCGGTKFEQRSDDNEESLEKRLKEYREKTYPLIDFYSKSGALCEVDAEKSSKEVKESVLKCLCV